MGNAKEKPVEKSISTKDDFASSAEVRWCPGCGDYSILAAIQRFLPSLNIPIEKFVFVSGIGCASRFPYYMNTYGFHTIHGRAPAVATGVKLANPELSVWLITGDGDALSIGGNHFIHMLRRNPDIKALLFNNRTYGLTKGQFSPTAELGKITKSSPAGVADHPINPIALALGAEATFVARTLDVDSKHMTSIFAEAAAHSGTACIEIYQNCVIFNDEAFSYVSERAVRDEHQLQLRHGELLVFGKSKDKGLRLKDFSVEIATFEPGNLEAAEKVGVSRYDATNLMMATMLSRLDYPEFPVPMGIFYKHSRPTYESIVSEQITKAKAMRPLPNNPDEVLRNLFNSGEIWTVN